MWLISNISTILESDILCALKWRRDGVVDGACLVSEPDPESMEGLLSLGTCKNCPEGLAVVLEEGPVVALSQVS
jgi:hypothetical protein